MRSPTLPWMYSVVQHTEDMCWFSEAECSEAECCRTVRLMFSEAECCRTVWLSHTSRPGRKSACCQSGHLVLQVDFLAWLAVTQTLEVTKGLVELMHSPVVCQETSVPTITGKVLGLPCLYGSTWWPACRCLYTASGSTLGRTWFT